MKLTKENYNIWLPDFLEGKLDASMEEAFMVFLEEYPEVLAELENEVSLNVKTVDVSMPDKKELKRSSNGLPFSISKANYTEFILASIEGDLSKKQEEDLSTFIAANPVLEKEYSLYASTVLKPDMSIVYPAKRSLKKLYITAPVVYRSIAVAASLLALIGLFTIDFGSAVQDSALAYSSFSASDHDRQIVLTPEEVVPVLNVNPVYAERGTSRQNTNIDIAVVPGKSVIPIETESETLLAESIPERHSLSYMHSMIMAREFDSGDPSVEPAPNGAIPVERLAYDFVYNKMKNEDSPAAPVENKYKKPDVWEVADLGRLGFQKITNTELEVNRNPEGKLSSIALVGSRFQISHDFKK